MRTFIDEGVPLAALLRKAVAGGKYNEYASKLLNLTPHPQDQHKVSLHPGNAAGLIEALSQREIEILKLIAAGKTNLEIASELFLAIGTIKRHIYNIFRKVGVDSRTQLLARARELEII